MPVVPPCLNAVATSLIARSFIPESAITRSKLMVYVYEIYMGVRRDSLIHINESDEFQSFEQRVSGA